MRPLRPYPNLRLTDPFTKPLLRLGACARCSVRYKSTSSSPKRGRPFGSYLWYPLCLTLGIGAGYQLRQLACPPPLPEPGTEEDHAALELLARDIDNLDIVKSLRAEGYHLHADTPLTEARTGKAGWRELENRHIVSDDASDQKEITRTLTQQSIAGMQGLGVHRAFWNPLTRELVAVVWCGGALTGWPGLTHGGAIATMFDEAFSRAVAGPDKSLAKLWLPSWKDFTKKPLTPESIPTVELSGTLETLQGKVCVRAKASFPASAVHVSGP
ncbi:hypothetical protein GQ43DRAFT_376975 [Delitschia confertaspora ATCC 74209]|uniref:Thioesterase domain-containing protein n=1 Tax=Delitschia confertaspora ATCC 74209 TaxID=1513339 RepID=A0A9P4MQN8_9PLEO|nr:hypothetical protein GQ43DRAFT_376975 [Delitschia confertaspora ATCC 74209]